jgi:ribonuclease BN (tRNA processing enzyme)
MQLTILGSSAAAQNPGGACSSYLVRDVDTAVVLDMGSGAFGNLQRFVEPDAVDAIIITHTHADHTLDLMPYRYWLNFSPPDSRGRPRLYLPPGGLAPLLKVSGNQDPSPDFYAEVFEVHEYDPDAVLDINGWRHTFHGMKHAPHTYGVRIDGPAVLAYSADTGPTEAILPLCERADLFLCECSNRDESSFDLHLKPREAGRYAREGQVGRLVLTHRWHVYGVANAMEEAASEFGGPISVAREGDTYRVGR